MKLTVAKKMYFGFFSILALFLVVGYFSQGIIKKVDREYQFLIDDRIEKISIIKDIANNEKEHTVSFRGYLLYKNEESLESFENAKETVAQDLEKLEGLIREAEGKKIYDRMKMNIEMRNEITLQAIEAKSMGDDAKALTLASQGREFMDGFNEASTELIHFQNDLMDNTFASIKDDISAMTVFMIIVVIISLIIGSLLAFFISRSISKPINLVSETLEEIAAGNLTMEPLKIKNRDEVGNMVHHLNKMVNDLHEVVTKVNGSALEVASQSQELSASSEESSAASRMIAGIAQTNALGSEKQLSVVNDMSTSIAEMTDGMNQIASSSHEMLQANREAEDFIKKGLDHVEDSALQMNNLNMAMDEISRIVEKLSEGSNEISNITSIINSIADQTNLLALNAAIEAARAGEAGKGFAVVADEVRKLAEQSKDSSSQIAEMVTHIQLGIRGAVSSIDQGNRLVESNLASTQETLKSFGFIEESSKGVTEKIELVASATNQLKMVADGILIAIEQVQTVAKEASHSSSEASAAIEEQVATMEQISASAQSLSALSEQLQSIVTTFKIS